jgi:hypothetical protein
MTDTVVITIDGLAAVQKGLAANLNDLIAQVGAFAFKELHDLTPVDTGYAQSRWTNTERSGSFEIDNDASYINVLDEGRGFRDGQMRGSEQAPDGMTDPTIASLMEKYK